MIAGIAITTLLIAGTQPTVIDQSQPVGRAIILWPGEKFIASERTSFVVMKADGISMTDVSILHQGVPLTAGAVSLGGKFGSLLHARIDLQPGSNSITLQAGGKKVGERSMFLPDPFEKQIETPPGFSRRDFHARQTETLCAGCHFKKDGEECAQCHSRLGSQKVVHAPVQGGQFDLCHGRAKAESARFALLSRPPGLCLQCHENIKDALSTKPFRHGPASAGECTLCHSPHSSETSFLLRRKAFDLCTSCHVEKKRRHSYDHRIHLRKVASRRGTR